jgi:uncharacterized protein YcbK (DUF882 family)
MSIRKERKVKTVMKEVSINKQAKLSPHFTLGELTRTSYQTLDGNIPSRVAIENLKNLCENWLEDLRYSYNTLYQMRDDYSAAKKDEEIPLIITSGYRSEEVNRLCGGAKGSNHLTGCAVDIRCMGPEHQIRMASILLDIADGSKRDFDELILEKRGTTRWIHFAVRPKDNRRKILFDMR